MPTPSDVKPEIGLAGGHGGARLLGDDEVKEMAELADKKKKDEEPEGDES